MTVIPESQNVNVVPGQVNQVTMARSTQKNLRAMIGEVLLWNPDAPPMLIKDWLNNAYRDIIDHRLWYGLMVRGELPIPAVYNTGQVTLVQGDATVVGTGTAFTQDMVGRQFRVGITDPIGTILSVTDPTHLELDLPWNGNPYATAGYRIFQSVFSLGANIKMLLHMANVRQRWRMRCNLPIDWIIQNDPCRQRVQQPWCVIGYPASPAGEPQFEMYPACLVAQSFPFIAYVQPPDLMEDEDFPYAFIRSDLLVKYAIGEAKTFRRDSPYYDPGKAAEKKKEYEMGKIQLERSDNNLYQKNTMWDFAKWPVGGDEAGIEQQDRE